MTKFRNILYLAIGIPLFIILLWLFAVPNNLIKEKIEDSISNSGRANISASIEGLRKGPFFTLYADSLDIKIDKKPALKITAFSSRFNPLYLIKKQLAFSIRGKLGTGNINGSFKLPEGGNMQITRAELNAIPYLKNISIKSDGHVSADFTLKDNAMWILFEIPDLHIQDSTVLMFPLIKSFHKIQGVVSLKGNTIKVKSVSLEGEKGYARIKGEITNGFMNLILELMPDTNKLKPLESMFIGKYVVSPGYYVIPIRGKLF